MMFYLSCWVINVMNTKNIFLAITTVAIAGILTGPTSIANAWLYDIYSDEPLSIDDDAVPFIEDYVDNLEAYVEKHNMESDLSNDFIV